MDGRDFGPPRSVHGPPPPLLSGLAMDSHRVGAATAGRLPASGLPGPLPPGKYMAGLNLHPHPGKCPAQCPPPLVPSGSCGGGRPRGNYQVCSPIPEFALGIRPLLLPRPIYWVPARYGQAQGVSPRGAEASLEALTDMGGPLCSLPRRVRLSRGAPVGRNGSHQGRFQTRGSCSWSLGWSFQNLGEKRTNPAPHPLETSAPELQCFSWQMSFQAPGVRSRSLASSLVWGLQLVPAPGVCVGVGGGQENRDPQHWELGLQRAAGCP